MSDDMVGGPILDTRSGLVIVAVGSSLGPVTEFDS